MAINEDLLQRCDSVYSRSQKLGARIAEQEERIASVRRLAEALEREADRWKFTSQLYLTMLLVTWGLFAVTAYFAKGN